MTDALAPLRHAPFRFLFLGRLVSMLGNSLAPIALAFAVLDLTDSVRDLGLVVACRSVANVAFLLFGGVVADRLPRRLVTVVSSLLAFGTQTLVACLVITDAATVPLLMVLGAANGIVAAFAFPATAALIPQTVPPDVRRQANAINRLGVNAASIVGASAGGVLVATIGSGWSLAIDAATFLASAGLFVFVRVADHRTADRTGGTALRDLRDGWREFVSHTWVWVVVVGFCFFNAAFSGISVLGPALADQTFGRPAWGYILGPVAFLLGLARTPSVAVLLPVGFLAGMAIEQFGVAWETSIQEHIPADKLARVNAILITAVVALLSIFGMLASRSVRTLEHRPVRRPEPAVATQAG